MRKIERKTQEDSLSKHKKIKNQLKIEKQGANVEYKDIAERIKELEHKNFTTHFKS